MAYASVISLKQTLEQILLHPHAYSIPCENKHIESFHEKLEFLQQFLEGRPSLEIKEEATSLERRIRDAASEAEDFMDLNLKNLLDSKYLRLLAAFRNDTTLCFKLMAKVDSIIREVTKIMEQGRGSIMEGEIKTGEFGEKARNAFGKDPSHLVSSDAKNLMVGFDDYMIQIKDKLTGESSTTLEVISIVGMGGIGKTTLATHVYNDPYVVNHFDICAWATISQSYSARDILLCTLDSMKILTKEMHGERDDQLKLHVYKNLKDRRYLIIIDDIWDTNAWDYIKMMFPNEKGSRIMLTTRIAHVAEYASQSTTLHKISLLSEYQSWKLLRAKVFGDEPCPLNLLEIGKTIAGNCRGLPLSIVVIGGLLSKVEKTQMAWQSVSGNVTSNVFSSDDKFSDILRLSYSYLPRHLKACFLYMAVFPKSHDIRVSILTKMWVAEGFLRQDHSRSPEEVAERCVEDLIDRSLVLTSKKNPEGKIKYFRIHDLLFDFCVNEAKHEKFLQIAESPADLLPKSLASQRRISIHRMNEYLGRGFYYHSMSSTSCVRSFVCVGGCSVSANFLLRFKLVRVLDTTEVEFLKFPQQVLELLNLRYLALFYHGDIPTSIIKLWNLQTLIISGKWLRRGENRLPAEIWTMVHLRHVRFDGIPQKAAPFDVYRNHLLLKDLQTLSGLLNLRFSKEMLQSIPNIKEIDVYYNDISWLQPEGWSYYQMENVGNLHHLKALKISNLRCFEKLISPSIIFKFQFPPSLKTLSLGGIGMPWHDLSIIIGTLPNLEVLKLKELACVGEKWEPNEEEFRELKILVLEELGLKHWKADSNHFPSLECLIIRWCNRLIEIPSGMGESLTLTTIELYKCNASVVASANEIRKKQLSYGNDGFQVLHADPKLKKALIYNTTELCYAWIMKDAADDSKSSQTVAGDRG